MTPKEYSASEAKRLLEELAPYFVELERQAMEDMVATVNWDEESDRQRRYFSDHIKVIRDVQTKLKSVIVAGAPSAARQRYVP